MPGSGLSMPANKPKCMAPRRTYCAASSLRSAIARPRSTISRRAPTSPCSSPRASGPAQPRRLRSAPVPRTAADLSDLRLQERGHPIPRLIGTGDVVGGAALVGEGVRRVVAIDLVLDAGALQHLLEIVDRGRRAPIVLVGEVPLERHTDLGRVGKILGRNAGKADP